MIRGSHAYLVVALAFVLTACAPPAPRGDAPSATDPSSKSAAPKRITVAISGELSNLRSQTASTTPGMVEIEQVINAGLAAVDEHGNLQPRLAVSIPSLDNGLWKVFDDGSMETTWVIQERARWHDGTPFTAADVHFTIMQAGKDRDLLPLRHLTYDSIADIDTPDSRTAVVRWSRVNIDADKILSTMGTPWPLPIPKHLLERSFAEDKGSFLQQPYWGQEFVGSGPYRLRDWVIGSHVILEANDAYVLGRPRIDEIEVRFFPDANTLVANVASGSVDVTTGRGLSLEQGLQLREMWQKGRVEIPAQQVVMLFPQFINPSPPIMTEIRFRQAVMYALDRQAMVDTLMQGQSSVAQVFFSSGEPEYRDIEGSIVRYEYDPRLAGQLMEQLGYSRGSDGILAQPGGQPLVMQYQSSPLDIHQKTLLSLADSLKRLGIGSEIEILAPQRVDDREYRSTRTGFELSRTPNSLSSFLSRNHGSQTPLPEDNFRRYTNKSRYMSPEFDGLIDAYFATIPPTQRTQVLSQIVRHTTQNLNIMPLFYDAEPMAIANRLANVPSRRGELSSSVANVHEWDLKS